MEVPSSRPDYPPTLSAAKTSKLYLLYSSNTSMLRAKTGMPSRPEEEDSLDIDRVARRSAVVNGPVNPGES